MRYTFHVREIAKKKAESYSCLYVPANEIDLPFFQKKNPKPTQPCIVYPSTRNTAWISTRPALIFTGTTSFIQIYSFISRNRGKFGISTYRYCCQYHESRRSSHESENNKHDNVSTTCKQRAGNDGQYGALRVSLVGGVMAMSTEELTIAIPHFRPNLSAISGRRRVPMTPPAWNNPFIVEIKSVPLLFVSSSK